MKSLINKVKALCLVLLVATPMLATVGTASASASITNQLCAGSNDLNIVASGDCTSTTGAASNFNTTLTNVINILSVIVGIIAVIMIVVGGFRYVASGGKQESVQGAKNTILYAVVGLVIVALAQVIVRFVLNRATNTAA